MDNKPSLKTNFIFNIGYQILVIILPLITAPYITRVLGAENTGIYSYTQAFANYFYLFAMLGVNNYGNRRIAQVRDNTGDRDRVFWEIFTFQALTGIAVALLYVTYCLRFSRENRLIYLMQFFYQQGNRLV